MDAAHRESIADAEALLNWFVEAEDFRSCLDLFNFVALVASTWKKRLTGAYLAHLRKRSLTWRHATAIWTVAATARGSGPSQA